MLSFDSDSYFFQKRKFDLISYPINEKKNFFFKFLFVFVVSFAFLISAYPQTGYIYIHLKSINEENSTNFPFTLQNSSGTTINSFNLNDQATADNVALSGSNLYVNDMGLSHGTGGDGQLWAVAGTYYNEANYSNATSFTIYERSPGSSQWVSTGITNAYMIDGAYANQFVYINSSNNVVFYNNGATTTIYTGGDAWDVTANGGHIAISNSTYIKLYSETYTAGVGPATGGTWTNLVNVGYYSRIDMNLAGNTIAYEQFYSNTVNTVTTGGLVTSLGTVGTSGYGDNDIAYDDNGNIYTSANSTSAQNSQIFHYTGSAWVAESGTRFLSTITGGAANMVFSTNMNRGFGPGPIESIYSRQTDNAGNIYWIDDDRIKNSSALNGNGIVIPVTAGTYTITETLPNNTYDLGRYNIYDPGNATTGNVSTQVVTTTISAGEMVFVEYVNEKLNPFSAGTLCGATQYLQTFDADNSSPILSTTTYGIGNYGSKPVEGTAYHYLDSSFAVDGYYSLNKVVSYSNWYNNGNPGLSDHTGNGGFFLLVDASYAADEFYRQRLTNLIIGASYTLSFYVADISPLAPIRPNVYSGIQDTLGNILGSTSTGNITATSWANYTFTFTATTTTADVFLRNENEGGNGNDLAIDDISLSMNVAGPTPSGTGIGNCSGAGNITVSSPSGSVFLYSLNGGAYQTSNTFSSLAPGSYTVTATYSEGTGCVSSPVTIIVPPMACGNVYDDANGLADNTVNGTGTNANGNVYANLVNSSTDTVVASSLVSVGGTFGLAGIGGTSYNVILTSSSETIGSTLISESLASGWASTGEFLGTGAGSDGTPDGILSVGTLSSTGNTSNANFGIDQLPASDNKTFNNFDIGYFTNTQANGNPYIVGYQGIPANSPAFSSYYSTLGEMTGSDPEDCSAASSCNTGKNFYIASISSTTLLYYNGNAITAGMTIANFNPSLLTIYGQTSQQDVGFSYNLVDAAGKMGSPATWSLQTFFVLSLQLESFTAVPVDNKSVLLNWESSSTSTAQYYEVWKSTDGQSWLYLGKVNAVSDLATDEQYGFIDNSPSNGNNYYRLKIFGDGSSTESNIAIADIYGDAGIKLGPNPALLQLQVSNMKDIVQINIYDMNGKLLILQSTNSSTSKTIDVSQLAAGVYVISFLNNAGNIEQRRKFVKMNY